MLSELIPLEALKESNLTCLFAVDLKLEDQRMRTVCVRACGVVVCVCVCFEGSELVKWNCRH